MSSRDLVCRHWWFDDSLIHFYRRLNKLGCFSRESIFSNIIYELFCILPRPKIVAGYWPDKDLLMLFLSGHSSINFFVAWISWSVCLTESDKNDAAYLVLSRKRRFMTSVLQNHHYVGDASEHTDFFFNFLTFIILYNNLIPIRYTGN